MLTIRHRFALLLFKKDGTLLGGVPLEPNWEPAVEWTVFQAHRAGWQDDGSARCCISIEPVPNPIAGLPRASGFRVAVHANGQALKSCVFPSTLFAAAAQAASEGLIEKNLLRAGEQFCYHLLAYPQSSLPPERVQARFGIVEQRPGLAMRETPVVQLDQGLVPAGPQRDEDIPVIFKPDVLEEAALLTRQAGACETGGVLIGHLQRAQRGAAPDLAVCVTAQIPAQSAEAELDKLTFTPATWAAVEWAIKSRHTGEIMLGWWHSHPVRHWVDAHPNTKEPRAVADQAGGKLGFFSVDDIHLHQVVFSKAFHIALVVTHTEAGCDHTLFGWRLGKVQARGFHLPDNRQRLAARGTELQECLR